MHYTRMKLLKLPWLNHKEEHRKYEIYSVDVSPDGKRVASGGLDGKVRIWSTESILQYTGKKVDETKCRPLASMSRHTGAVTTVRWSPDGKYLVSGSDDRILLVWELEEGAVTTGFGGIEQDLEHWAVRKRLMGHDNDIQDSAWAPDASILVTVGLDRSVIVWNGTTFEKIKRFDVHQSLVKGVVFDPANKYFATASDDRTVRIFRYHKSGESSFSIEHVVSEPFKGSPLTTYFRRLSWSPDGQHIAVPNGTNGPVSAVAIIDRGSWDSDFSLIGHDAPTEVAEFNPRLFEASGTEPGDKKKINSIVATAGQDKTLAIWNTSQAKPILTAYDACLKSITDLAWSPDGRVLFLASLDGSITVAAFDPEELGKAIPLEKHDEQLHRYGADKDSTSVAESVQQLLLEEKADALKKIEREKHMDRLMTKPIASVSSSTTTAKVTSVPIPTQKINILTPVRKVDKLKKAVLKNGKKRVAPTLISTTERPKSLVQAAKIVAPTPIVTPQVSSADLDEKISRNPYQVPRLGVHTLLMGVRERRPQQREDEESDSEDEEWVLTLNKRARKMEDEYTPFMKYNQSLPDTDCNIVQSGSCTNMHILEIRNGVERSLQFDTEEIMNNPTKLLSYSASDKVFEIFIPEIVNLAHGFGNGRWVVATTIGFVYILSRSGQLLSPKLAIASRMVHVSVKNDKTLLIVTEEAQILVFDIVTSKRMSTACMLPLLPNKESSVAHIDYDDTLSVKMASGELYQWNSAMQVWMDVSSDFVM